MSGAKQNTKIEQSRTKSTVVPPEQIDRQTGIETRAERGPQSSPQSRPGSVGSVEIEQHTSLLVATGDRQEHKGAGHVLPIQAKRGLVLM